MKQIHLDIQKKTVHKKTEDAHISPKPQQKHRIRLFLGILMLALFCSVGVFLVKTNRVAGIMGINTNPGPMIGNIISQKPPELDKDSDGRTNILIAGIDSRSTDSGLRNTDTIMVASYNYTTNDVILISIPRDMMAPYPDNPAYFTKINAIYNHCEQQEEGTGLPCLADTVSEITTLDIQYYAMVNIAGMVEIVDLLGGIDVDVERAFSGTMPTDDDRAKEAVSFEAGVQHMDGKTAMQYARTRYTNIAVEGNDYARSRRQQRVIKAMLEKAMTLDIFTNPVTVMQIVEELGKSIAFSEITTEDIRAGVALRKSFGDAKFNNVVLDPTLGNWQLIMVEPNASFRLIPKLGMGKWANVHIFLAQLYEHPGLYSEGAKMYVYNGGIGYDAAYATYQKIIKEFPYLPITFGGNASIQTMPGNTVVNFKKVPPLGTLTTLAEFLAGEWTSDIPTGVKNPYGEDVVIILGAPVPEPTTPPAESDTSTDPS